MQQHPFRPQMDRQSGIYALLMHLGADRRIAIGALGKQRLPAGWYAYVGSAYGPGGLRRRTDRHKRHQKTLHWHIDYFTAAAELHEIWFARVDRSREHDWVAILAGIKGAEFPLTGFGAQDCRSGCRAHLLHFEQRPLAAVLRAELSRQHPLDAPLRIEFMEPGRRPANRASPAAPLMESYLRGQRLLELRRNHENADDRPTNSSTILNGAAGGRQRLSRLADELGIETSELRKDAELAEAVNKIIGNCGAVAAEVLFNPIFPQHRKAIMQISRTSRERQRYRIEGVAAGRMRSVSPQGSDQVPDTVNFREVVSRLERARGAVEVGLGLLKSRGNGRQLSGADIVESVKAIQRQLRLLTSVLDGLEIVERPTIRKVPRPNRPTVKPVARLQLHQMSRQLKAALKLVAKNVRDLPAPSSATNLHGGPASSYDLRPTAEELRRARAETRRISTVAKGILQILSSS